MPRSAKKRTRAVGTRRNEGVRAYPYADRVAPIIDALERHGGSATAAELFDWLHNDKQYGKMFKEKRRINATWRQLVRHMDNPPYVFDGSQFRLRKMQRNGAGKRQKIGQKLTRGLGIDPEVADIPVGLAERTGRQSGHRYQESVEVRRAIERRAMRQAEERFTADGWTVADVSARESYDLRCERGSEELHVEVKGTQSDGREVLLTKNEVAHARNHYPHVALYILARIEISERSASIEASGGEEMTIRPWRVDDGLLAPLAYSYTVPTLDST